MADQEPRRVVTTHKADGEAVILFDGPAPKKTERQEIGVVSRLLWVTGESPAAMDGTLDKGNRDMAISPPPQGSVLRIVDFLPGTDKIKAVENRMTHQAGEAHKAAKAWPPRHPMMHRTASIDYAIVLSGEIDMLLDKEEIHLKAGDILVQQATNHAWVNRGTEPCRIVFVLIDGKDPLA